MHLVSPASECMCAVAYPLHVKTEMYEQQLVTEVEQMNDSNVLSNWRTQTHCRTHTQPYIQAQEV